MTGDPAAFEFRGSPYWSFYFYPVPLYPMRFDPSPIFPLDPLSPFPICQRRCPFCGRLLSVPEYEITWGTDTDTGVDGNSCSCA